MAIFAFVFLLFFLLIIAGAAALAVWVYHDAQRAGMESPGLWALLVVFTTWIGLIIYLVIKGSRQPGRMYYYPPGYQPPPSYQNPPPPPPAYPQPPQPRQNPPSPPPASPDNDPLSQ